MSTEDHKINIFNICVFGFHVFHNIYVIGKIFTRMYKPSTFLRIF